MFYSEKYLPCYQILWAETNIVVHRAANLQHTDVAVIVNNTVTMVTAEYKQRPLGALYAERITTNHVRLICPEMLWGLSLSVIDWMS